jgi:hypothetical protein
MCIIFWNVRQGEVDTGISIPLSKIHTTQRTKISFQRTYCHDQRLCLLPALWEVSICTTAPPEGIQVPSLKNLTAVNRNARDRLSNVRQDFDFLGRGGFSSGYGLTDFGMSAAVWRSPLISTQHTPSLFPVSLEKGKFTASQLTVRWHSVWIACHRDCTHLGAISCWCWNFYGYIRRLQITVAARSKA